jgi:hypothetical protein
MLRRIIAPSAVLLVLSSLLGGCLGAEHRWTGHRRMGSVSRTRYN